jgi:hypothetical protein
LAVHYPPNRRSRRRRRALAEEDCDDNDAAVNPRRRELCDGLDNNCDGIVDEGVDQHLLRRRRRRRLRRRLARSIIACEAPEGAVAFGEDCDDADAAFNPGASETDCDDPNDYNCDGSVRATPTATATASRPAKSVTTATPR